MIVFDCINLIIKWGECFGLVGELGLGKIIVVKIILWVIDLEGGEVVYNCGKGFENIVGLSGEDLMDYCCWVQLIFQDLFFFFNLCMIVNDILIELFEIYSIGMVVEWVECVCSLMNFVGLDVCFLCCYLYFFLGG